MSRHRATAKTSSLIPARPPALAHREKRHSRGGGSFPSHGQGWDASCCFFPKSRSDEGRSGARTSTGRMASQPSPSSPLTVLMKHWDGGCGGRRAVWELVTGCRNSNKTSQGCHLSKLPPSACLLLPLPQWPPCCSCNLPFRLPTQGRGAVPAPLVPQVPSWLALLNLKLCCLYPQVPLPDCLIAL